MLPVEGAADSLENLRDGFGEGGGLDQRPGDHVLGRQCVARPTRCRSARAPGVSCEEGGDYTTQALDALRRARSFSRGDAA